MAMPISHTHNRQAFGPSLGRRPGSKDAKRRQRAGYVARWEWPGERELARQRALNNGHPENEAALNSGEVPAIGG